MTDLDQTRLGNNALQLYAIDQRLLEDDREHGGVIEPVNIVPD
jgi:hypothetical protein